MKKQILLLIFLANIFTPLFSEDEIPTLAQKICDINMKSFPREDSSWETHTMLEYVNHLKEHISHPSSSVKRNMGFEFFNKYEKTNSLKVDHDNSTLWEDLDLFRGKKDLSKYTANSLSREETEIGKISFYEMLSNPTADTKLLKKRQELIKFFIANPQVAKDCKNALAQIASSENFLLAFLGHDELEHNANDAFFNNVLTKKLNDSQVALLIKNSLANANRLRYFALDVFLITVFISYGTLNLTGVIDSPAWLRKITYDYKNFDRGILIECLKFVQTKIPQSAILLQLLQNKYVQSSLILGAGVWSATELTNHFDWVYGKIKFEQLLQEYMYHLAKVTDGIKKLQECCNKNPILAEFEEFKPLLKFFDNNEKHTLSLFQQSTFNKPGSIFCNHGAVFKAYGLMKNLKDEYKKAIVATARIDVYVSLATLVKEFEDKPVSFTFPQYVENSTTPFIELNDFWHPILDPKKAVPNSIELGINNQRSNVILTGPNEGGKSTVLKSLTLSIWLAQTCGIAPAKNMCFTPFVNISTYLNITDDIGAGNSLFKAEVLRAQKLIDSIKSSKPKEFSFSVFDEVFNGTSPIEGSAAAHSVAKHLGSFSQSICLIATHFDLLTMLEDETTNFQNYKVSVIKDIDEKIISYPYKLEFGKSEQHIALDVLKNQGFDSSIIKDAQEKVKSISFSFM
ncbi:MAG: hypothetical protein UR43_C0007G0069 [candidate division TM6 bacterium GW2011_GWF2_33_332]|nr:MAG: hypothetical protein UR43_C0007G0069 [candidate division TM6 bacterium GW2011_GWF2_33_332]